MNQASQRLLDAHVAYMMDRLRGKKLARLVEEKTEAAFTWMSRVKLERVVNADQVMDIIMRNVVERNFGGGIPELAGEMTRRVLDYEGNETTRLSDIFPRRIFDEMVDRAANLRNARENLINRTVRNEAYQGLVSDLLLGVVKDFLLSENLLSRQVPGLSPLLKLGKNTVNRAAPGLSSLVEDQIRDGLARYVELAVRHSERFLVDFLDENRIAEIADAQFRASSGVPLASHFANLDSDDMEDFIVLGYEFWLSFRKTPYFVGVVREVVVALFEKYGDRPVTDILDDMGLTSEQVVLEIVSAADPVIKVMKKTGFLEKVLIDELKPFYESPACREALAGPASDKGPEPGKAPAEKQAPAARKSSPAGKPAKSKKAAPGKQSAKAGEGPAEKKAASARKSAEKKKPAAARKAGSEKKPPSAKKRSAGNAGKKAE